ncbi:MAG TPA: hypothetical protein VN034_08465 [Sphingopyxis sp.]|nr:hypothetical protein [Sphingopyxis sp.]
MPNGTKYNGMQAGIGDILYYGRTFFSEVQRPGLTMRRALIMSHMG